MTTTDPTSPASMGEPLSEAELAQARTYVKHRESYGGISVANLTMLQRLLAEVDRSHARVGVLEGQLATARGFINERRDFVRVLRQYTNGDTADYIRWTGHAEARRTLAELLGIELDDETGGVRKADGGDPDAE